MSENIAVYSPAVGSGFSDNPLVEALPRPINAGCMVSKLQNYPLYKNDERYLAPEDKINLIGQISRVFVPLPVTLRIAQNIDIAMRNGYVERNPLSKDVIKFYHENYNKLHGVDQMVYSFSAKTVSNIYMVGSSGVGKSTNVTRVLSALYDKQVIQHVEYKGSPFIFQQIVFIKISVPFDGSVKGILYNIFSEVDRVAQTNYYNRISKSRATVDEMLNLLSNVSFKIGMLVVDEIQNINMQKSSGTERVMNFFTNLSNLGLPIVLIGTAKSLNLIKLDFKQARRSIGIGGNILIDRLKNDEMWRIMIRGIWKYQYTLEEVVMNDELVNLLYDLTQGIPDLLVKLYQSVQLYCILNNQKISPKTINKVYKDQFYAIHPVIRALRSNNLYEIAKYEDILIDTEFLDSKVKDVLSTKKKSIEALQSELNRANSYDKIKVNKNEIQVKENRVENLNDIRFIVNNVTNDDKNAYEKLKHSGIIISFDNL